MSPHPPREAAFAPRTAGLVPHPDTPCPAVRSLQARASLLEPGLLSLGYSLVGDLDRLVLPPAGPSERMDRLWKHTCFEAFLARPEGGGYCELNIAPSTAWAAYAFEGYREGGRPAEGLEPRIVVHRLPGRLEVHGLFRLDQALPLKPGESLKLGLSAVLEQKQGGLSYWAIRHPGGRPDFHAPGSFALELLPLEDE